MKRIVILCHGTGHWGQAPHWHLCDLEPGHEGKHRWMSCKVEFGR